jgi:hypothetical protein
MCEPHHGLYSNAKNNVADNILMEDLLYKAVVTLVNDSNITSFCEAPTFGVLVSNYGPSGGPGFQVPIVLHQ